MASLPGRYSLCACIFIFIVIFTKVSSGFGVGAENGPFYVFPGETKEIKFMLGVGKGEGDSRILVSVLPGSEYGNLIEVKLSEAEGGYYEVRENSEKPVMILISASDNAQIGYSEDIEIKFVSVSQDSSQGGSPAVGFEQEINHNIKVIVGDASTIPYAEKSGMTSPLFIILSIIAGVVFLACIVFAIIYFREKNKYKSPLPLQESG
jgi:hypothetical protein